MDYITTYFKGKIAALNALLEVAQDAWDQKIWLAVVITILWTVLCTIGGLLLFPIDFVGGAIAWHKSRKLREALEAIGDGTIYN